MKTIENQQIQPGWGTTTDGKRRSLPARVGSPQAPSTLKEFSDWCQGEAEREEFLADLLTKQVFIKGGSRFMEARLVDMLAENGVEQEKDEKREAFLERTFNDAKAKLPLVAFPDALMVLDHAWENRRGEAKIDPVIELIRTKWDASEKKAAFLVKFGIAPEFEEASAAEVEAAYRAVIAERKSKDLL